MGKRALCSASQVQTVHRDGCLYLRRAAWTQFGRLVSSEIHERREKKKHSLWKTLKTFSEFKTALYKEANAFIETEKQPASNESLTFRPFHLPCVDKTQDNPKVFLGDVKMGQPKFTDKRSAQKLSCPLHTCDLLLSCCPGRCFSVSLRSK